MNEDELLAFLGDVSTNELQNLIDERMKALAPPTYDHHSRTIDGEAQTIDDSEQETAKPGNGNGAR